MPRMGIDLGASTAKIVLEKENQLYFWQAAHHGQPLAALREGITASELQERAGVCVTGSNARVLTELYPDMSRMDDIPAVVEGVRCLVPTAGSIIEIGSQSARFITDLDKAVPRFAVNEHCAGGTGSFFEDQMSRLGLKIEDYSRMTAQAESIPRLSGRCAVFAKTDIIHRQQEGVSTPDILLGLCYAMVRNYKAVIVRDLPVKKPVVFCGGVTQNSGVVQAIREIFGLAENELIVPANALFTAAAGALRQTETELDLAELKGKLDGIHHTKKITFLPVLTLHPGTALADPAVTGVIPAEGCALGIDIGSTSTDLVLTSPDGALIDFQYLRTAGNPEQAVRNGLKVIRERYGEITFRAVGVTGSGRERMGRLLGADAVRDEITAQAKAAVRWIPEADTVFEIGGQDSKYICLEDGEIKDFQMNKICAAGTGSFVEEQAARMGIPIAEFGPLALTAETPADLGERCTVFIETAIASAAAQGTTQAGIAAGLCHSIVRNYLHKVVGSKPVGQHIVLQGGVAYNSGIVAAFQSAYGERITVSPCFSISGAYGAALLALEAIGNKTESSFKGFDFPGSDSMEVQHSETVRHNVNFYRRAGELLLAGYDGSIDPKKKTVGVPYVLMIHKLFPMANAFFKSLGFNVLLSDPTNEDTIRLSQQLAQGETCYPIKLIYGHMQQLIDKKVDYIFLPAVHTMKHEQSHVAHNYGCVYMQTAPHSIARAMKLEEQSIRLLSPVFDLDFGQKAMAGAMVGLGKQLNRSAPLCVKALMSGAMAVRKHTEQVEKQGKILLDSLKPEDKVLVLITRNYGVSDPILNMGIPELLLERGHKVITLSHLPAHDLDISADHPNLYWPFGQHILSGAKIIAHHPNLYAVYLTNHGCGPDSMLNHLFRQEMGEKPYLQIEVDEHFSKVGVITRIEAFLNVLSHRPAQPLPAGFDLKDVNISRINWTDWPTAGCTTALPDLGLYNRYLTEYAETIGIHARVLPAVTSETLDLGRTHTNTKEYLPFSALLGSILQDGVQQNTTYLLPTTRGAEADGQYTRAICSVLDKMDYTSCKVAAPVLEILPTAPKFDLLCRAILTADLLYAAPSSERATLAPTHILDHSGLLALARKIGALSQHRRRLAAVGTPLCLTVLNEDVLDTLEAGGEQISRAPLSEYLWMLWHDQDENKKNTVLLTGLQKQMAELGKALGAYNTFANNTDTLLKIADNDLSLFAGGNGRYRYAKAIDMGKNSAAVLAVAPRYENTAMVMDMRALTERCPAPLFQLSLDGDWDETAWNRLRSFLYYCK